MGENQLAYFLLAGEELYNGHVGERTDRLSRTPVTPLRIRVSACGM